MIYDWQSGYLNGPPHPPHFVRETHRRRLQNQHGPERLEKPLLTSHLDEVWGADDQEILWHALGHLHNGPLGPGICRVKAAILREKQGSTTGSPGVIDPWKCMKLLSSIWCIWICHSCFMCLPYDSIPCLCLVIHRLKVISQTFAGEYIDLPRNWSETWEKSEWAQVPAQAHNWSCHWDTGKPCHHDFRNAAFKKCIMQGERVRKRVKEGTDELCMTSHLDPFWSLARQIMDLCELG